MAVAGAAQAIRVSERPVPGKPSGGIRPEAAGDCANIDALKQTFGPSGKLKLIEARDARHEPRRQFLEDSQFIFAACRALAGIHCILFVLRLVPGGEEWVDTA
jgi:hypothetical protein